MSDPFVGQITPVSFGFAPKNWAMCNGALLPINQNQALFSLLGTRYGGNGTNVFQLPDLRSRTPVGASPDTPLGQSAGSETVTLLPNQIPLHTHAASFTTQAGAGRNPTNALFADSGEASPVYAGGNQVMLGAATIGNAGGNQAHPNLQPYSVLNFCIALTGVFPSRN